MRRLNSLIFLLGLVTTIGCTSVSSQPLAVGLTDVWELASAQIVWADLTVSTSILAGESSQVALANPEDYSEYGDGSGYLELELSVTLDLREDESAEIHRVLHMDGELKEDLTASGSWEVLEDDLNGNGYVLFDFDPLDGYFYASIELLGTNGHHQEWDWEETQSGSDSCIYRADWIRAK